MRCDANVSLRRRGTEKFGTRTETKNLNSFRFVQKALEYEIVRQAAQLENGEAVVQETRLYDSDRDETRPMRSKEEANDYRYFPEPDLPPLVVDTDWVKRIADELPELALARAQRFEAAYGISAVRREGAHRRARRRRLVRGRLHRLRGRGEEGQQLDADRGAPRAQRGGRGARGPQGHPRAPRRSCCASSTAGRSPGRRPRRSSPRWRRPGTPPTPSSPRRA